MTRSDYRVAAGADDGFTHGNTTSIANAGTDLFVNTSATNPDHQSYAVLTPDAGATLKYNEHIDAVLICLTQKAARSASYDTKHSLELALNPVAPTSKADLQGRARVGTVTHRTGAAWVTDQVYTVELRAALQAVVDQLDFDALKRLNWLWDFTPLPSGVTNNLHGIYSYNGAPTKAPWLEVSHSTPAPDIYETFTAADGTSLNGKQADKGGVWTAVGGWTVLGNRLRQTQITSGRVAYQATGTLKVDASADFYLPGSGGFVSGLLFHYIDASNYWRLAFDSRDTTSKLRLVEVNGGTTTIRASWNIGDPTGLRRVLRCVASGKTFTPYLNGVALTAFTAVTLKPSRLHGLTDSPSSGYGITEFDNYRAFNPDRPVTITAEGTFILERPRLTAEATTYNVARTAEAVLRLTHPALSGFAEPYNVDASAEGTFTLQFPMLSAYAGELSNDFQAGGMFTLTHPSLSGEAVILNPTTEAEGVFTLTHPSLSAEAADVNVISEAEGTFVLAEPTLSGEAVDDTPPYLAEGTFTLAHPHLSTYADQAAIRLVITDPRAVSLTPVRAAVRLTPVRDARRLD